MFKTAFGYAFISWFKSFQILDPKKETDFLAISFL